MGLQSSSSVKDTMNDNAKQAKKYLARTGT